MRKLLSFWPSLLGAVFLVGCGGADPFDIEIVSRDDCNGLNIIEPGNTVALTVRGPGMDPVTVEATGADSGIEVPDIPEGKDRVVSVEVWSTVGGRKVELRARGESAPFQVTSEGAPSVRVVLYRTNYFSEVVGKSGSCTKMREARAGHIGVSLSKNEVLLAGGYTETKEGRPSGILASAEVFDFRAGAFKSVAPMPSPRALAQAAKLNDGRVIVIGGVREEGGALVPVGDAAIFDGRSWTSVTMNAARRDFTATLVEDTGEVLVVGGVDAEGQIVPTIEAFDPTTNSFRVVELEGGADAFVRAYHSAILHRGDLMVVGGIDAEGKVMGEAALLTWDNARKGYFAQEKVFTLEPPVLRPALLLLGSVANPRLVIAGGHTVFIPVGATPGEGVTASDTRIVQSYPASSSADIELHAAVGESCALALDNSRGLVFGGTRSGVNATPPVLADFLRLASPNAPPSVAEAGEKGDRKVALQHTTCAPIGDKGVLIAGGLGQDGTVTGVSLIYLLRPDSNQG